MPRRWISLLVAVALCASFPAVTLAAWGPCAAAPRAAAQPRHCCCEVAGRACEGCGCTASPAAPDAPATPAIPADVAAAPAAHDALLAAPSLVAAAAVPPRPAAEPLLPGALEAEAGPLFLSVCSLRR